eukprot:gene10139-10297_t
MARGKRSHDASLMRLDTKQHRSAAAAVSLLPGFLLVTLMMSGLASAAAGPDGPSAADGLDLPLGPTGALPPPLVANPDRAEKDLTVASASVHSASSMGDKSHNAGVSSAAQAFAKAWTNKILLINQGTKTCLSGRSNAAGTTPCPSKGAARFSIKIGQSDGLVGIVAAGPSGNCLQYDAINSRFTMQPASNTCNTLTLRPVAAECNPADSKQAWQLCKSRADCAPLHRELLRERQRRQTTQQTNQPPAPEACAQLFSEVATASSATVASALGYSEVAAASATADIQSAIQVKLNTDWLQQARGGQVNAASASSAGCSTFSISLANGKNITTSLTMTSAPAASSDTAGFKYIGCYADGNPRAMPSLLFSGGMTIYNCFKAAQDKGFRYFGLQNGAECWASNDWASVSRYRLSSNCGTPCNGYGKEMCGGPMANSVYQAANSSDNVVYLAAFWPASSGSNKAEVDNAMNQLNSVLRQEDARFQVAVVGYEQVGDDQLGTDMTSTTLKHYSDSQTYIRRRAAQWGADLTLIVAPSSLSGNNNAMTPGRQAIEFVRNGGQLDWVIATVKRGDLGSYVSLHELGHTFGLPHNREEAATKGGDWFRDYSWGPWTKISGHCNSFFMWCWDWHYDAGAVSIMSYIETCDANIYRPDTNKHCNRALRYGAATVTVTDIPKTGDLWGDIYHHSHDQFMGDANNNPARALRETGPLVTNYRRHGCKWWDGVGFTNGEQLASASNMTK